VTVDGSNRYRSSTTMVTLCLPLTTDAVSDPVLGRRWIAFLVFEQDISVMTTPISAAAATT
jgi:hypothetical protein